MRYQGKVIAGGDRLFVSYEPDVWLPWIVSDWSTQPEPAIYGRLERGGSYERLPVGARWDVPPPPAPPRYVHRPSLGPTVAEVNRQNAMRFAPDNASSAVYIMPSSRRRY